MDAIGLTSIENFDHKLFPSVVGALNGLQRKRRSLEKGREVDGN
jgi:hypothetical protein